MKYFILTFLVFSGFISAADKPNFIIIFTDDLGYQDVGCFGAEKIRTPNIDRMASEGMKFTNFYAQTVCGPSRAALMTGCYPLRVAKKNNRVEVHPHLHSKEITIAEMLKPAGYTSGCFGKWDLAGHHPIKFDKNLLPPKQGFDYYFGTPASNDSFVTIVRNLEMIEKKGDMSTLTKRYTDEAISFIKSNKDKPFFVYVAHTMPHTVLAASKDFKGKSERGLYGDVVEEIDFNVGRILDTVKELNLDEKTYVIFTSDNGPWYLDKHPHLKKLKDKGGSHGGDAAPLRGHKTSTWEGGVRVPFVIRAPGKVPAGKVCAELASTMDIFPTFAALGGGEVPSDRIIDGKNISDLIEGKEGAQSPTKAYFYYANTQLMAVRSGKWKLHLPMKVNTMKNWGVYQKNEDIIGLSKALLYNLDTDIGEKNNLAEANPEVVKELMNLAKAASNDIGDYDRAGKGARFFDPQPIRPDTKKWQKK